MGMILAATLVPLLFYIILPLGGAFSIRQSWKRFRKNLTRSTLYPLLHYNMESKEENSSIRCFGKVQGYGENKNIWVKTEETSLLVDLQFSQIYQIPTAERKSMQSLSDLKALNLKNYKRLSWNEFQTLPEGSRIYVFGEGDFESQRIKIKGSKKDKVYVVVYEGENETVITRALWGGRQLNEAWNSWTPWSMSLGFFLMITLVSFIIQQESFHYMLPLTLALTLLPILLVLPPGVILFVLYLRCWIAARNSRAERDMILYRDFINQSRDKEDFPEKPFILSLFRERLRRNEKRKTHRIWVFHTLALLAFGSGLCINFFLAFSLIKRML